MMLRQAEVITLMNKAPKNKIIQMHEEYDYCLKGMEFAEMQAHNKAVAQAKVRKLIKLMRIELADLMLGANVISEWGAIADAIAPLEYVLKNSK